MDQDHIPELVKIERPVYEHEQLKLVGKYEEEKPNSAKQLLKEFLYCKPAEFVKKTVPIIGWLSQYNWKQDLSSDIISGFTVAIMHIPQGMAYALLGNVHPIVGIYTAFFPVLIYAIFGTSRHNSMGTFAVVCLLTGSSVLKYANIDSPTSQNDVESTHVGEIYTPIQVVSVLSLIVAGYQLIMYTFRLGVLSSLLSETFVSGFTTGAAICVLTSQIKDLLGVPIPKHIGYFVNVKIIISIFQKIDTANYMAVVVATVTIVIMCVNQTFLKPWWSKKVSVPLPIELIAVLTGTLVSKYCYLQENFAVEAVGSIPSGMPAPMLPPVNLIKDLLVDGLTVAIISYTITLSMALIFAQKLNYEVDANQELLAMSLGNGFGSFFSCIPFTASLSRSLIQQTVGGKTQLASLVSCGCLVFILLWIGPFFEPLPKSVLAGIIVVALKGMLTQVTAFYRFYKLSKLDATVWMVTFLTVVFVSIDMGLFIGIGLSLLSILALSLKPSVCLLGNLPNTDLYVDVQKYHAAIEISHLKIFHYQGSINFASKNYFKSCLCKLVGIDPSVELEVRKKLAKLDEKRSVQKGLNTFNSKYETLQKQVHLDVLCLILDFSALSYIDPSGAAFLKALAEDFKKLNIPMYLCGLGPNVYDTMEKCGLVLDNKKVFRFFPTVHDAVLCATAIFGLDSSETSQISTISRL